MVICKELKQWMDNGGFHFKKLVIDSIDNQPVLAANSPSMAEEETCIFSHDIKSGDDYLQGLQIRIMRAMQEHQALPVVRFADGEYAFYHKSLECNGLYRQAESVNHIQEALPLHIEALRLLSQFGLMAALIFPGNIAQQNQGFFAFIRKWKEKPSASTFISFLNRHEVVLTGKNYIPFYVVYAYLTSAEFAATVNGKNICILNSEYHEKACHDWFAQFKSTPRLSFVNIPAQYVATRWEDIRNPVLNKIPPTTDLCLAGAGIGALLVCKDIAEKFSIPAIDAGHVLNMMNGRVDKSNGARLYTLRKVQ